MTTTMFSRTSSNGMGVVNVFVGLSILTTPLKSDEVIRSNVANFDSESTNDIMFDARQFLKSTPPVLRCFVSPLSARPAVGSS